MKGIYTITKAEIKTPSQWKLHDKIVELKRQGKDYIKLVRKLNRDCFSVEYVYHNIIPTVGRTLIANNFTAISPDNTMLINYIAVGTGSTAVNNADTKLDTELDRNQTASRTNSNNIGYVTGFYSASEAIGTLKEAAMFSDAIDAIDDGILISRVLLNAPTGIAKTAISTFTVDWILTIS